MQVIETSISEVSNNETLLGLRYADAGYLLSQSGDYNNALEYLEKSIILNKRRDNLAVCYNNIAYSYLMKEQHEMALNYVNRAINLNVNYIQSIAHRTRAFIYIKRKDFRLASDDLKTSLKYNPKRGVIAEGYKLIGNGYKEIGDKEQSLKFLELSNSALLEKFQNEAERNKIASEVMDKIFKHQKKVLQASVKQEATYKNLSWSLGRIIIALLIGLFYYRKINNMKLKSSIEEDLKILNK